MQILYRLRPTTIARVRTRLPFSTEILVKAPKAIGCSLARKILYPTIPRRAAGAPQNCRRKAMTVIWSFNQATSTFCTQK